MKRSRLGYRKGNKIVIEGNIAKVYCKNEQYFICDAEDVDKVAKYTWRIGPDGYAKTGEYCMFAHHLIAGRVDGLFVDHINRNRLDNRKANLRHVDRFHNNINKNFETLRKDNPATGVYINKKCKSYTSYIAKIKVRNKSIYLGCFTSFEEALKARREAEIFYWGEQANEA